MLEKKKFRIKIFDINILYYLILIPFMRPRGFDEYIGIYKTFFTVWLYGALVLIGIIFVKKIIHGKFEYTKQFAGVMGYYLCFIGLTLFMQGRINQGLQKLFAAPALYIFLMLCLKRESRDIIECLVNILIFNFICNITFFSPWIWNNYFAIDNHIIFLGHVQVAAQFGILGIYLSYLLYKIEPQNKKSLFLFALSIITMLMSKTSASFIIIGLFTVALLAGKWKKRDLLFNISVKNIYIGFICINLFLIGLTEIINIFPAFSMINAFLSGRTTIWTEVIQLMKGHWIAGYGAYGALIQVFWHVWSDTPEGMNYAHNELLQRLLDGGIILLLVFLIMLYLFIKEIERIKTLKEQFFSKICLVAFMALMCIESVTEYFLFSVFLSLVCYLPEISEMFIKKDEETVDMLKLSRIREKINQIYYPMRIKKVAAECGEGLYVGGKSYVTATTHLGMNVCFNGMAIHGKGKVTIGNYFHSGPGCQIITSFHNYEGDKIPYDETFIDKDVSIGDCVWLGNNVIILGGVTIGEGAIIQAGSVVCKDIPACAVAGGHPAIPFKYRNKEHYEELKSQKAFH